MRPVFPGENFSARPTLGKRFPAGGTGIKKKPYNRGILRKNLIIHGSHFLGWEISGKNFLTFPTLGKRFPSGIFLFSGGSLFGTKKFRKKFFGEAYFRESLFQTDFLGKNFIDKLSGLIWQKTPGTGGGGGSGGGTGGVPGGICLGINEKAPGVCGNSLRGHVPAPLIHGN